MIDRRQERYLVVRLTALGDILHTLPAVAALRAAHRSARIDWVVERKWAPVLEGSPAINEVIPFDRRSRWERWTVCSACARITTPAPLIFRDFTSRPCSRCFRARRAGSDLTGAGRAKRGAALLYTERVYSRGQARCGIELFPGRAGRSVAPCDAGVSAARSGRRRGVRSRAIDGARHRRSTSSSARREVGEQNAGRRSAMGNFAANLKRETICAWS